MGKPMVIYAVTIFHTRSEYSGNTEFLKIFHIKSDGEPEYLRKTFTKAFQQEHPDWPIKQVNVEKE